MGNIYDEEFMDNEKDEGIENKEVEEDGGDG